VAAGADAVFGKRVKTAPSSVAAPSVGRGRAVAKAQSDRQIAASTLPGAKRPFSTAIFTMAA
jgi:hypothetical protein